MNRGGRREPGFQGDLDRQRVLETLDHARDKTGRRVQASNLRPNHYHPPIQAPRPNLVVRMKWLLGVYTSRLNLRHQVFGNLLSGR